VPVRGRKLAAILATAAVLAGGATATLLVTTAKGSTASKVWSFAPHMPHRRSYTASAESGGKIYVAAGMVGNTGRPLNIFERFNPATDTWQSLPFVPDTFSAAAGAARGDRI
jgi:hypothetical protein